MKQLAVGKRLWVNGRSVIGIQELTHVLWNCIVSLHRFMRRNWRERTNKMKAVVDVG